MLTECLRNVFVSISGSKKAPPGGAQKLFLQVSKVSSKDKTQFHSVTSQQMFWLAFLFGLPLPAVSAL